MFNSIISTKANKVVKKKGCLLDFINIRCIHALSLLLKHFLFFARLLFDGIVACWCYVYILISNYCTCVVIAHLLNTYILTER